MYFSVADISLSKSMYHNSFCIGNEKRRSANEREATSEEDEEIPGMVKYLN